ncbi:thiamine biosynthesis protein [Wilcoxina mikolae CBS 423.85]|nr:thiamine biosynthesis protein [Wilcoxina mikolae CBS 423.85]
MINRTLHEPSKLPTVLTIAGSDPSGGAGIEADLKVITAHNCYGMTTITALTAQNTVGVRAIHYVPEEFVEQSLAAVFEDMPVDVIKTGMLGSAKTIDVIAKIIDKWKVKKLVLDPVIVSTSGSKLLPDDAIESLLKNLLPKSFILTPNVPEALLLLKREKEIEGLDDMKDIAAGLGRLGSRYVYLKGGHVTMTKERTRTPQGETGEIVIDVFYDSETEKFEIIEKPFIDSKNTHGTGCSLASAIASNLAKGLEPGHAVEEASKYIAYAIETAPGFGKGNGPVNHVYSNYMVPFAPGHFLDYLKGHPKIKQVWQDYTRHEFVKRIGDGTLRQDQFCYYLKQDYIFLIHYARSCFLAGSKATTMENAVVSAKNVQHIYEESSLHIEYCKSFGISKAEIEATEEDNACTAYTRYVLDIGHTHDFLALTVAMAPCLFGYHEIGEWLLNDPNTKHKDNPYYEWILNYGQSDSYSEAVKLGRQILEQKVRAAGPDRLEELVDIFLHATKLEKDFWDMGLNGPTKDSSAPRASF